MELRKRILEGINNPAVRLKFSQMSAVRAERKLGIFDRHIATQRRFASQAPASRPSFRRSAP